jgi:GT2 family glycosyltransferase
MDYTNRDVILSLGGEVDLRTGWGRHHGWGENGNETSTDLRDIKGFLDGSAMMFVLRNLQSIGLFNERYFLYHEESEWCYRARRAGFRLLLDGRAIVWHKGRGTVKVTDPRVQYLTQRNRVFFLKEFASKAQWLGFWIRLPLEASPKSRPGSGKPQPMGARFPNARHVVRGVIDGLFGGDRFRDQYKFD